MIWSPCLEQCCFLLFSVVLAVVVVLLCVVRLGGCKGFLLYWTDWKCETGYLNHCCYFLCSCVTFRAVWSGIFSWSRPANTSESKQLQTNVNVTPLCWFDRVWNTLYVKSFCIEPTKILYDEFLNRINLYCLRPLEFTDLAWAFSSGLTYVDGRSPDLYWGFPKSWFDYTWTEGRACKAPYYI